MSELRSRPAAQHLVLFDIDGTLLRTDGAGIAAMGDAGRELFGDAFITDGVEFAGRLDTLIFHDLFTLNQRQRTGADERRLRERYAEHLARRLAASATKRALSGVVDLVHALRAQPSCSVGLLTGNFPETGRQKLSACGLDPTWFHINAWGDDSTHDLPDREHLPPVAMARFRDAHACEVSPANVTIIGDTPHDVRCARANGCRSIAVATGQFTVEALAASGADLVVPDLTRTNELVAWVLRA